VRDSTFDKVAGGWYGKLIGNQLWRCAEGKSFEEVQRE